MPWRNWNLSDEDFPQWPYPYSTMDQPGQERYHDDIKDQWAAALEGRWGSVHDVGLRNRWRAEMGLPPWGPGVDDSAGGFGGDDWWSGTGQIGPQNRYEEILQSLLEQTRIDPHQEAVGGLADTYRYTPEDLLSTLGYTSDPHSKHYSEDQAAMRENPALLSALASLGSSATGAASGLYGSLYGGAGQRIGQGYRSLQGFRGQDMERYLREKEMEMQTKIAEMQARMQAAAMGGGDSWLDWLVGLGELGLGAWGLASGNPAAAMAFV